MNQPGHLMDEADIGSGEQENAERDALKEEISKIPEDNRPDEQSKDASANHPGSSSFRPDDRTPP